MGLTLNGHWLGGSKSNGYFVNVHPFNNGRVAQSGHNVCWREVGTLT